MSEMSDDDAFDDTKPGKTYTLKTSIQSKPSSNGPALRLPIRGAQRNTQGSYSR